jgi:hypothetical protein
VAAVIEATMALFFFGIVPFPSWVSVWAMPKACR